ncbi:non-homologous end-joining DNA ligase [Bosea lathyri]|uniref:DNA ligase (ATP) n=1 Tax=Bosea lathyri TaxID=1036778 RepID=A0A1H6BLD5_9HYPH|nr:non-homologous end-joining DNA ligase [Bosea lathyri]SEG61006.1 bifunctional non-homologous end joining protein LigD [Bosea lathyri]
MCARRVLRSGPVAEIARSPLPKRRDARQRALTLDPMPDRVEPCLALLASKPPVGDQWAYEVKWDGYRLAVHVDPGRRVRILTRGGFDWTLRFPTIAHDIRELGVDSAIIDGEAVVLDERGASDFGALQQALGGRGGKRSAAGALLYAFDLLYLDGRDLRALPLSERRRLLIDLIGKQHSSIRLSEEVDAEGAPFLKLACEMGLEGIIAKRLDAPYRAGRGGEWLKIKCVQSETFVVIGYEFSASALGGLGRLLLAARKGSTDLVYVGGVGTGFGQKAATAIRKLLDGFIIPKPAIPLKRSNVRWVTPMIPVEIQFRAWTNDGKLRHASYKGMREDADMADIFVVSD